METITCAAIILIAVSFGYLVALGERAVRSCEGSPTREQFAHEMAALRTSIRDVHDIIKGIPVPEDRSMPTGMYFPSDPAENGFAPYVPMSEVKKITK